MGEAAPQAVMRTGAWCRLCKQPVRLAGPADLHPELQRAVHAETGSEIGPGYGDDGSHIAMPTDENPVLRAEADEVEAEFPDYKVSARLGGLRATLRRKLLPEGAIAVPIPAGSGHELRTKLRAAAGTPPAPRKGADL